MTFNLVPANLMALLRQTLEVNLAYAEQYGVVFELAGELPTLLVHVDVHRLQQVLANLLSNAAKFSPAGDKVTVMAKHDGGRVRISISDRGCGIAEQFHAHIFEKFAQADATDTRNKGGTGLGLSITRAIVEQMGGCIGFESQPGVLTTFWIEFPVWQTHAMSSHPARVSETVDRVLICDDDPKVAALLHLLLEQSGMAADIADNAGQARQMLEQHAYRAMTLDLGLPEQSGISLIRELRAEKATATLPIIVVSVDAAQDQKELNGDAFSVIDWIDKPIDAEKLAAALSQAVKREDVTRPRVLHVEDDTDIAAVVSAIIGELADVDHASNLAAARSMLASRHYDLAILDLGLPDGSGMELLPLLNDARPAIPVMVFSAHEVAHQDNSTTSSVLVKSRTDNAQLLASIKRLIGIESQQTVLGEGHRNDS